MGKYSTQRCTDFSNVQFSKKASGDCLLVEMAYVWLCFSVLVLQYYYTWGLNSKIQNYNE